MIIQEYTGNVDISSWYGIQPFVAQEEMVVATRISLANIYGHGGSYSVRLSINGTVVLPVTTTTTTLTSILFAGRKVILRASDQLLIEIQGTMYDTDVSIQGTLFDATPLSAEMTQSLFEDALHSIEFVKERIVLGPCQNGTSDQPAALKASVASVPSVGQQKLTSGIKLALPQQPKLPK